MNNFYIFSKNKFSVIYNGSNFNVNNFSSLVLSNINLSDKITVQQNCYGYEKQLTFSPYKVKSNNFYNVLEFENNYYMELISLNTENLCEKLCTKNCEITLFENSIMLTHNQKIYTYAFNIDVKNYAIELNNILYIFNNVNLLKIDLSSYVSTHLITQKLEITENNYEILCKIPKNNIYFLLINFNLSENTILLKKLKNENEVLTAESIPYIVFYLCKLDFEECKSLLSQNINYDNIKHYLSSFDNIMEIDGDLIVYSKSKISKIKFDITNNIVNDID